MLWPLAACSNGRLNYIRNILNIKKSTIQSKPPCFCAFPMVSHKSKLHRIEGNVKAEMGGGNM
jgi:hypothetical protein